MGYAIFKCERDADLYILWSSVTESWSLVGTRAELTAWFREQYGRSGIDSWLRALDHADETGTSDRTFGEGVWDDDDRGDRIRVMEGAPPQPDGPHGDWYIPRDHLYEYANLILEGREQDGWELMVFETYDDEDD